MPPSTERTPQEPIAASDTDSSYTVLASTDPAVPDGRPAPPPNSPAGSFLVQVYSANLRDSRDGREYAVMYTLASAGSGTSMAWAAISETPGGATGNSGVSLSSFPSSFTLTSRQNCPDAWSGTIQLDTSDPDAITLRLHDRQPITVTYSNGVLYGGSAAQPSGSFELTVASTGTYLVGAVVWDPSLPTGGQTVGVWGAEAGGGDEEEQRESR